MTLPYIINAALILAACLAFYKVLLRRETFYQVNRYLLIICLGVSFALPLLQVPMEFSMKSRESGVRSTEPGGQSIVDSRESIVGSKQSLVNSQQSAVSSRQLTANSQQSVQPENPKPPTGNREQATNNKQRTFKFSFEQLAGWVLWIYWFGVIVFAASFLFQIGLLIWRAFRHPVIKDGKYRIVELRGDHAPCSFGNIIFINPAKYDWEVYNQILSHEKIHVRQKHTVDIMIAELVLIFQWFNPFAWIYRREIENNLEFLTDDQLVQQKEVDKKNYQLSLVKVSAPNLPLRLTNNYNQSILKTRIAMMNKKRSNLHTAWKYFFLLPLFAFLACLLNEPAVKSQEVRKPEESGANDKNSEQIKNDKNTESNRNHGIANEGYWYAVIKDDKVNIRFSEEKLDNMDFEKSSGKSFNGTIFKLSELSSVPKGTAGDFTITREAGTMKMNGKFDGNTGMGTYKFAPDKAFVDYMSKELGEKLDEDDQAAFFFINIRKDYLQMLRSEGYAKVDKEEIISMAALSVDAAFIRSMKRSGLKDLEPENLVSLKALGVDEKYVNEIRGAGYKNVTSEQLVSFKAQGIDAAYVTKVKQMKLKGSKDEDDDGEDIVSFKAMGIDEAFVNSFKSIGMTNLSHEELVSFKALGVTPEYIKSWHAAGFKDIEPEDFTGMKSQNITPEYMKSFTSMGYKGIEPETLVAFKALGVTPEYIRGFEAAGYKNIDPEELTGMKSQGITPEFIKGFETMGFKNITLEEIVSVKAMGVTPEYIKEMRAKGLNYDKLHKYITLKSID